ncbi:hypothetical protein [Isoptericola aurantiacus]|uniref:hypothetical protein n=1 Tax=Isoptericola aurantiacus TaxID=3377839 RepID=UPI00383B31AF
MSSTQHEQSAESPAGNGTETDPPTEPEEHLLVDPTRVRRAPKLRAFFTVGAVVGVVAGLWLGSWLSGIASQDGPVLLKPGVFVSVITLGTTTLTVLLAGALAVWADRRSLRRR